MQNLVLDFETHYGTKYTLKRMTYLEYITDERFYVQGFSYSLDGSPPVWVTANDVEVKLQTFDWPNINLICQNTHFDASILKWYYGISPGFYSDTMLMARQVIYGSTSLDSLTKALFPNDKTKWKGKEIVQFKDVKYLDANQEKVMAGYCNQDVYITRNVYEELLNFLPEQELELIDMTIRMAYDYNLQINTDILEELIEEEMQEKKEYIETYGETCLRSNQQFAGILEAMGVNVPMKVSPKTGKMTYAFSKTDQEFMALREDPVAGQLIDARLKVKSNILETRAQRFIDAQQKLGYLPIILNYCGARNTARWSGGQKMNQQNLSRGSKLRDAITAPEGYTLVVNDLSQIENRVLAWLAKDYDALARFAKPGFDPYKAFGAKIYSKDESEITKSERQIAKAAVLGLGYGMGWEKFMLYTKLLTGIEITEQEAKKVVNLFRSINYKISGLWEMAQTCLIGMSTDRNFRFDWQGCTFGFQHIMKPNGTFLNYSDLQFKTHEDRSKDGYMYGGEKGVWKYIYGGLCVENLTQSLARDIIADQMVRIKQSTGFSPAHMVHDELIYVVKEDQAEQLLLDVQREMNIPPSWCADIPLNSDGDIAKTYGSAK